MTGYEHILIDIVGTAKAAEIIIGVIIIGFLISKIICGINGGPKK